MKIFCLQVKTFNPVTLDQIEGLQSHISQIDDSVDFSRLQKRFLTRSREYQAWVDTHTQSRTYTFQVCQCPTPIDAHRQQVFNNLKEIGMY